MWQRQRRERERTLSTCRKPTLSTSSRHGGWLCFLLFYATPSALLQAQINMLIILYFHSQASWNCPRGGYACYSRHFVETLQWVWTAKNIPPGHLPLHHHPSTAREKGKERTGGRAKHSTFHLQRFLLVGIIIFCCWLIIIIPLAGRVCVAQTVCRQPRPRLCWTAESWPGKFLTARCITPCSLQW